MLVGERQKKKSRINSSLASTHFGFNDIGSTLYEGCNLLYGFQGRFAISVIFEEIDESVGRNFANLNIVRSTGYRTTHVL